MSPCKMMLPCDVKSASKMMDTQSNSKYQNLQNCQHRSIAGLRLNIAECQNPQNCCHRSIGGLKLNVLERRICESVLQILDMGAAEPEFCKSRDQDSLAGALESEKHMPSYKHRKCNNSIDCCDKSTSSMNIYEKSLLQRHRFVKQC